MKNRNARILFVVFCSLIAISLFVSCRTLPKGYAIEYQLNGGKVDGINPSNSTEVTDSTVLINPEKNGYSFLGWVEDGSFESAKTFYTFTLPIEHDILLTATWQAITGTISYDLQGGSWSGVSAPKDTFTINDASFSIPVPYKHGYTFIGWTDGSGKDPVMSYTIDTKKQVSLKLTANWIPTVYFVEYDKAGYVYLDPETPYILEYTIEDDDFNLPVPVREGYTFVGWHFVEVDDLLDTMDCIYTDSCMNYKLEAVWVPETFKITYELDGGYLPYDIKNPESYCPQSETFTITNPVKENCQFIGWVIAGDESMQIHPTMTIKQGSAGDLKLYAVFQWSDVPVGTVTEIYKDIPEFGAAGVPRPDWVIKAPADDEYHYEKAYGKASDFYTSLQVAVGEAMVQHSEWMSTRVDSYYLKSWTSLSESKRLDSERTVEGREVVEYWVDQDGGVWVLVRIPIGL